MAMIFPRMEIDHLAEWLRYQHRLGVSRVHLWFEYSVTDLNFNDKRSLMWSRRPEANFHPVVRDNVIHSKLIRIVNDSPVEVVLHQVESDKQKVGWRQIDCQNSLLARYRAEDGPCWLLVCDIDELIVTPGQRLTGYLEGLGGEIAKVFIKQHVYECRWRDGEAVQMSEITTGWGYSRHNRKCIYRVNPADGFHSCVLGVRRVHGQTIHFGKILHPTSDIIRFNHFRGNSEGAEDPDDRLDGYTRFIGVPPSQMDCAHNDQLQG